MAVPELSAPRSAVPELPDRRPWHYLFPPLFHLACNSRLQLYWGDVTDQRIEQWALDLAEYVGNKPHLASVSKDVEASATSRCDNLEAKAIGILAGLSIVTAVILGVQANFWHDLNLWERAMVLVSDFYAALSLAYAARAGFPRTTWELQETDMPSIERLPHRLPGDVRIAGARLAYARGNDRIADDIATLVTISGWCALNAVVAALPPFVALLGAHLPA